jgi:hypothetical protein
MPLFRGKIVNDRGRVVTPSVEGFYQQRANPGGTPYWFGELTVPRGEVVPLGPCQLVLDDGRSARIRVQDGTYKRDEPGRVQFEGQGSLP